jgi:hypothetical protein
VQRLVYRTDGPGFKHRYELMGFLKSGQADSWHHPASYLVGSGILVQWYIGWDAKFTDVRLVSRLRMGGAIHLLPLYAIMARIGPRYLLFIYESPTKAGTAL